MLPRQASCCNAFCVSAGRRVELSDHEVHHVVGVALGVNAIEVPRPAGRAMIEGEQSLFGERVKKLNDEERIAGRLLVHQLRQRCGAPRLAAKRIRDQLPEVLTGERRQRDLARPFRLRS